MSKLPWSRVLREAKARGEVIKRLDNDTPVMYKPRVRFDPEPWYDPVTDTHLNGQACYADVS